MCKLLTTLLVSFLVGCGRDQPPPQSAPQSATERPTTPDATSKPQTIQSPNEQRVPAGWVKIVNESTGSVLGGESAEWHIEMDGKYGRLTKQEDGQYAALANWAKHKENARDKRGRPLGLFHFVPEASGAALWTFKHNDNGSWTITEHETRKCLESPANVKARVVRLASHHDGDARQQWKLERSSGAGRNTEAKIEKKVLATTATAATPTEPKVTQLDCSHLQTGDQGVLGCAYVEVLKVVDDHSCIALPYLYGSGRTTPITVGVADLADVMQQEALMVHPGLPLLFKGISTADKVTGEKLHLSDQIFRVTGTEDAKRSDGSTVRLHVLELVKSAAK